MPLSLDMQSVLARGEAISAELKANAAGHRRFVIARPYKEGLMNDADYHSRPWRFRVFSYELDARLVEEHVSMDMLTDFKDAIVDDVGALEKQLALWAPLDA